MGKLFVLVKQYFLGVINPILTIKAIIGCTTR